MSIANLPRYEMGRCSSCGDCNRDPAYVDESGEWVKFEEAMEASSNSLQQLKAEIAAIVERLQRAYAMRESPDVLDCISEMRQLSAV